MRPGRNGEDAAERVVNSQPRVGLQQPGHKGPLAVLMVFGSAAVPLIAGVVRLGPGVESEAGDIQARDVEAQQIRDGRHAGVRLGRAAGEHE